MSQGGSCVNQFVNDRIDFFCARAEHQGSEPNDALTMHEDRWAYCSAGAGGQHEWRSMPSGAMSLDDVKRFLLQHLTPQVRATDQRSD